MIRTFRDPQGYVEISDRDVKRFVSFEGEPALLFAKQIEQALPGSIISTLQSKAVSSGFILEHPRIPFISYPSEWSPSMLWAAGKLTADLALAVSKLGGRLKDASAYNVLFDQCSPIFVDLLSFEKRPKGHFAWRAYEQFCAHFLRPLALFRKRSVSTRTAFSMGNNGIAPTCRLKKQVKEPSYQNDEKAAFVHTQLIKRASRQLKTPPKKTSFWNKYSKNRSHYSEEALNQKHHFIDSFLKKITPQTLLDMGANTGEYSFLAAEYGARVVAIDSDESAINTLFQKSRECGASILPLVIDICCPTPASGFNNRERFSFLERAKEHFDAIFCLALLHHLLLKERIPLDRIVSLLVELAPKQLVIERIGAEDPMAQDYHSISPDLMHCLDTKTFRAAFEPHFNLIQSIRLEGMDRELYWFELC